MPYKPKKPCRYPGCPNLTDGVYCNSHQIKRDSEYNRYKRDPELQRIYNGKRWRALAQKQLHLKPLCEMCLKLGRFTKATIADHITPIKQGGAIYDLSNLQSLCIGCHNKKTAAE